MEEQRGAVCTGEPQGSGELPQASTCPQELVGTYSKLDPSEVHISLLQPVIEVLRVVGGVALSVCGHAEDYQGLVDLGQAAQVGLERQGCHHHGLSPQLRNRVAGGKACQEAPHASPINLKPSLEMGEDPSGRSVEGIKCTLE